MIDGTEITILTRLQKNAREKRKLLADDLKITESALSKKIKKLEHTKVIKRYTVELDNAQLGLTISALTLVKEKDSSSRKFDTAADICKIPEAQQVYRIMGDWDFAIIWLCKDAAHLADKVQEVYTNENVERTNTTVLMQELKKENGAPLEPQRIDGSIIL